MKRTILAALAALCICSIAHADETKQYPLLSPYRLSIGARTEYAYWSGKDATQLPSATHHEWGVGLAAAYALVPHLQATSRVVYFVDSRITQYALGVNLQIFSGPEQAAKDGK